MLKIAAAVLAGVAALTLAACSSSPSSGSLPAPTPAAHATVMLRSDKLGTVLVDAKGDTLYTFSIPRCTGLCAQAWPPDYTKAVAGAGVVGRFGTVKRDGKEQVTYDGHALYTYAGDTKAGETRGNGLVAFGGTWWAATPSDVPLANRTSSGGGSGYAAASNVIAASSTPEGPDVMFHSGPQCEIHADGPC